MPEQPQEYWVKELCLTESDKLHITKGRWLDDKVVHAAQTLLKKTYPHIEGLQNPLLAQTLEFETCRGRFVQVLNVSEAHWITVSNINCKPGVIAVYDSKTKSHVPSLTKKHIAAMVSSNEKKFTLTTQNVQQQRGSNDCGLFALAFCMHLIVCRATTRRGYLCAAFASQTPGHLFRTECHYPVSDINKKKGTKRSGWY